MTVRVPGQNVSTQWDRAIVVEPSLHHATVTRLHNTLLCVAGPWPALKAATAHQPMQWPGLRVGLAGGQHHDGEAETLHSARCAYRLTRAATQ